MGSSLCKCRGKWREKPVERNCGQESSEIPMIDSVNIVQIDVRRKGRLIGMTVVDDQLFIVDSGDPVVTVYVSESETLASQRRITIPDMKSPRCLAGCSHNKILYISDSELKCIHRVILTDNSVKRWSVRENYWPRCLSVTSEHNVLVTVWIRGSEGDSRILEYTSEGQLIQDIELDGSIKEAWQALQLSSDQFIVCHAFDYAIHRLCVINSRGEVIKSYGRERGRGEGQLDWPHAFTIDINRGHVFVADYYNDRILVFSEDLSLLGQVQTHDDFSWPQCLYFDSNSDRLFIDNSYKIEGIPCMGVTAIDETIFAVYENKSFVLVYDSQTLTTQRHINVPDMKSPRGLASCPHYKALYISDWEFIHSVDLNDNFVKRWRLRENYRSGGLSVTSGHNVLVTVRVKDTQGNRLVEYTSEGELIRDIHVELDRSIDWAWQTVQLSSDQFIICHGLSDSSLHRLCVINTEDKKIKSYGREKGCGVGQLNTPRSLTLDNNRGHVYIADSGNNRVLIFSKDLTLIGQVQTREHIPYPLCLYYDSSSDRLFIGQSSGCLLIIRSPDSCVKKSKN